MLLPAISILLLLAGSVASAAVPYAKLRQVAERVSCQCGCSYTVGSCNMLNCHFRDPILQKISTGLEEGTPEDEVLEAVYEEYGGETRVEPRNEGFGRIGWIAPFASLAFGLAVVIWVMRRWRARTTARSRASEVPDDVMERYRAQIEEDLEELE